MITLIIAGAIVLAGFVVVRAIPDKAEVRVKVGDWEIPAGVVVSTDGLRSELPGLVLGSMLGMNEIEVNAGEVAHTSAGSLTIDSWLNGNDLTYRLASETRYIDAQHPFAHASYESLGLQEHDTVLVITLPDDDEALVIIGGVERDGRD